MDFKLINNTLVVTFCSYNKDIIDEDNYLLVQDEEFKSEDIGNECLITRDTIADDFYKKLSVSTRDQSDYNNITNLCINPDQSIIINLSKFPLLPKLQKLTIQTGFVEGLITKNLPALEELNLKNVYYLGDINRISVKSLNYTKLEHDKNIFIIEDRYIELE
jgi:hypothetical protein